MKKIALFLVFTLIFGSCLALVSCNSNSNQGGTNPAETKPAACSHKWKEATTSAPKTCTLCGKTEGEPISAYEALNSKEREVFQALKTHASTLDDPSSLKLLELKMGQLPYYGSTKFALVKVSSANKHGSSQTDIYLVGDSKLYLYYVGDDGERHIASLAYFDAGAWPYSGSIGKINTALKEYYDDMGW